MNFRNVAIDFVDELERLTAANKYLTDELVSLRGHEAEADIFNAIDSARIAVEEKIESITAKFLYTARYCKEAEV